MVLEARESGSARELTDKPAGHLDRWTRRWRPRPDPDPKSVPAPPGGGACSVTPTRRRRLFTVESGSLSFHSHLPGRGVGARRAWRPVHLLPAPSAFFTKSSMAERPGVAVGVGLLGGAGFFHKWGNGGLKGV